MGKRKIYAGCFVLFLLSAVLFSGCGKKTEQKPSPDVVVSEPTETPELPTPEPSATPDHVGEARSRLTGLWVKKKTAEKRPLAIMLNNIKAANPQSGIGEAAILYEAVVEGGITRLMGIFEEPAGDRIGSVRSARHYYVSVADEYDAIFAHFGQTSYALDKIAALGVDNLSGLEAVGNFVYYRDTSIKAPHNAFTSAKGIRAGIGEKKYRTKLRDGMENHFAFAEEETPLKGEAARQVTLGFSSYTSPSFQYNAKTGKYDRFQFGGAHIDRVTGKTLSFKNLIIQYVSYSDRDKNHYQTIAFENNAGEGLYLSGGQAVKITWDKKEADKTMHYYDEKGKLLQINPGKTYIALFPSSHQKQLVLKP